MKTQEYITIYNKLLSIYSDFQNEYDEWLGATTKKEKKKTYLNIEKNIKAGNKWIERYPECLQFITLENSNEYSKAIAFEELKTLEGFKTNVEEILNNLEEKII